MHKLLLTVLQYIALVLSSILGLYGLTRDFKDKSTGKITHEGRVARTLLLGSLVVGLLSHTIQVALQNEKELRASERAAESAEQTLHIAKKIERLVSRVDEVKISGHFSLRLDDPLFYWYRDSIKRALDKNGAIDADDLPALAEGDRWSNAAERALYTGILIQIYRSGETVSACPLDMIRDPALDVISYEVFVSPDVVIWYEANLEKLILQVSDSIPIVFRHGSREAISMEDFRGSKVVITPNLALVELFERRKTSSFLKPLSEVSDSEYANLLAAVRFPEWVAFSFDHGRRIQVDRFERRTDRCFEMPFYVGEIDVREARMTPNPAPTVGRSASPSAAEAQ